MTRLHQITGTSVLVVFFSVGAVLCGTTIVTVHANESKPTATTDVEEAAKAKAIEQFAQATKTWSEAEIGAANELAVKAATEYAAIERLREQIRAATKAWTETEIDSANRLIADDKEVQAMKRFQDGLRQATKAPIEFDARLNELATAADKELQAIKRLSESIRQAMKTWSEAGIDRASELLDPKGK